MSLCLNFARSFIKEARNAPAANPTTKPKDTDNTPATPPSKENPPYEKTGIPISLQARYKREGTAPHFAPRSSAETFVNTNWSVIGIGNGSLIYVPSMIKAQKSADVTSLEVLLWK